MQTYPLLTFNNRSNRISSKFLSRCNSGDSEDTEVVGLSFKYSVMAQVISLLEDEGIWNFFVKSYPC